MTHSRTCVYLALFALCAAPATVMSEKPPEPEGVHYPGVIARVYNEPDFTRIKRTLAPQDSLVTFFDDGRFNGNPPSLVYLGGSRLAAVYGYRGVPYSIRARISDDLGRHWGREILLRNDVVDFDSGYVRSMRRTDGKVLSVYYLKTQDRIELHFEATIWDPYSVQ